MPTPLPPAGGPIDDADSPMEARPQIRANIIDINPGLDIDGCKWVRASEATVTRYEGGCKITCDAGLACRATTSGPKSVIVVNGEIQSPTECDVVSIKINGITVPFRKYQSGRPLKWYYETRDEWLYTGEVLFPLCEYQLIEVFTSCGDVCQFRLHSCGFCYNATIYNLPATTISRTYAWNRVQGGSSVDFTLTESLRVPAMVFSSVQSSICFSPTLNGIDVSNAYDFEVTRTRVSGTNPLEPTFLRAKIYNAGVRFNPPFGASVSPRGNCTIDSVVTYPAGSPLSNISIIGRTCCWAFGAQLGNSSSLCPTSVGPGKFWISNLPTCEPLDICGGVSSCVAEVYPSSNHPGRTCSPYLDLGRAFGYQEAPSWTCSETYTYERSRASV
jgi:hypothetical protein